MERSDFIQCLDLNQGEVRRLLFFASLAWLTVGSGLCELNGLYAQGGSMGNTDDGIHHFLPDPEECPAAYNIKVHQLFNELIIAWDSPRYILQYELQYKEATQPISPWISVPIGRGTFQATISSVNMSSSYMARLRCVHKDESCSVCVWSREINIPHKLVEKPTILENTIKEISQGRISIVLKWKTTESRNTIGYCIKIERIPSYCPKLISFNITENWLHLDLSMVYYRISISASNEAGESPPITYTVPDFTTTDLPVQINISKEQNYAVITWNLKFKPMYIVIDWGTGIEDMNTDVLPGSEESKILDNLQPYKLYKVIMHAFDYPCKGLMTRERTLAMTYFYAVEGVPRIGPANVSIPLVTKHSAVVKWTEIPAEECLGFLQAYRIHYTEILKNISLDIAVNSSTKQYHLKELKAKTLYSVHISGVTRKGEGAQSKHQYFTTLRYDQEEFEGIIAGFCLGIILTLTIAVILCSLVFKRSRKMCWPAIPNPRYSSAIQNMGRTFPVATLGSFFQAQPSNGANQLYVEDNRSKTLLRLGFLSMDTNTRDTFADQSEAAAGEKLDTSLNPLKIPDEVNAVEKGKAGVHSDYVGMEFSHRAMQKLSASLLTRAIHLPKELSNNSGRGGQQAACPQGSVKQNQAVLRANNSICRK